jgi:hypothetical protein
MKKFLHLCSFLVALSFVGPASAVTNGDLDGENHPYVGLMVGLIDGAPQFRCTGTLISPTLFVTAGHCTEGINEVEIWFDADVESGIPGNGYPSTGDVSGTPFVSPDYVPAAFFVNDLGVVELNQPVDLAGGYAQLVAEAGVLDAMKTRRGRQNQDFTAVGYGLQLINPVFIEAELVRMVATPHLIQINTQGFTGDFSMMLSNNHSTGGTCFGDSGGPNFIGDTNVIGGVTSFGINGNCAGTGGVYRLDRAHDLAWFNGGSGTIHILRCDEQGKKIDEFSPKFIENARALLGATRLPDDRGYAVGYSHDNSHGNKGSEFWVAGFDLSGDQIFKTRIFGAIDLKVEKSKGGPGGAGTARMVYNEKAGHIGFYLAHNMLWGDGVRHQAGFIGFINEKGKRLPGGNGWFFSHNFDQRLIASGGDFYALAHGDAYPRALGFSRWSGNGGKKLAGSNYHTIPGESGANKTNCQTGGLVALPGGRFAVVFASLNEREGHDICIQILDSSGQTTKERWLTENGERDGSSTYPRIARYGEHIFVAWHDSDKSGLQHIVVDRSLETVVPQSSLEEVKLSPYDDLYNLDNGAIVWAVPQDKNKVRIFRIDQPAVLAKALIERNAKVE